MADLTVESMADSMALRWVVLLVEKTVDSMADGKVEMKAV